MKKLRYPKPTEEQINEELLQLFKPEERLFGLRPEERLEGLSTEERVALSVQLQERLGTSPE